MAENSIFWTTGSTGDGASEYTQDEVTSWLRYLLNHAPDSDGVLKMPSGTGLLNQLEVTDGGGGSVDIDTGAAFVYGLFYYNNTVVNKSIPTPTTSTRVDLIVLEADYTAQTIRITIVSGTEGAGAPSLTQSAGATWQIPLAEVSITTGGAITITDTRQFLASNLVIKTDNIQDDAVTIDKLASNSVDTSQVVADAITTAKIPNRTRNIWLQVTDLMHINSNGSTDLYQNIPAVELQDSLVSQIRFMFAIPEDYVSGGNINIKAIWTSDYASGGQIRVNWDVRETAAGLVLPGSSLSSSSVDYSHGLGGPADIINEAGITVNLSASRDLIYVEFERDGTHGNDTTAGSAYVYGFEIEYTADS